MVCVAYTAEVYFLTILNARHLRSRCGQIWFLERALREDLFQASFLGLWMAVFSLCFYIVFPLYVSMSNFFFSYKNTSHIGLGPI